MARWIVPVLMLFACKSQPVPQRPTSGGAPVYEVLVTARGFEPAKLEVPPTQPVVLRFTRKLADSCGDAVVVQGDPVKHMLPLDKPVDVRVTAPKEGKLRFACGMDMLRGEIVVVRG
jgi:plastocyanin domain-containing protein